MVAIALLKKTLFYRAAHKETQQLASVTGLNGPLRIYRAHGWGRLFWITVFVGCTAALFLHIIMIAQSSAAKSTNSQLSFKFASSFVFPRLTICNFNSVKRSYIDKINKTGDFSSSILQYLLLANDDAQVLYSLANYEQISNAEREYQLYKKSHPELRILHTLFSVNKFYHDAGFTCPEVLKMCSFAGRTFDCCAYAKSIITSYGLCQVLNLQSSKLEWMKRQSDEGIDMGLQLILDAHIEEQVDASGDSVLPDQFENGFWFYIDEADANTYIGAEGISASPGGRVYSRLVPSHFHFLDKENWGDCTSTWPKGYEDASTKYGQRDCVGKCRAKFFNDACQCAPFEYNGHGEYRSCTPLETYECIERHVVVHLNSQWSHQEDPWEYVSYNSYGRGYSDGALKWLSELNGNWTAPHVKSNFVTMNVYFRDMYYTEYTQAQMESMAEVFGDLGGSMGGYVGMSIVTCCELLLFLWKMGWVVVSSDRRQYMGGKKERLKKDAEDRETAMKTMKNRVEGQGQAMPSTSLAKRITNVVRKHSSILITVAKGRRQERRSRRSSTIRSAGSIKKERKRLYIRRNHSAHVHTSNDYLDGPQARKSTLTESDSGIAVSLDGSFKGTVIPRRGSR